MNPLTAIEILCRARDRSHLEPVKTKDGRQALVELKAHCPQRDRLDWFWGCADSPNEVGRHQNLRAALYGILRQLGLPTE